MPLLDIATAKPSFQSNIFTLRPQTLLHNKCGFGNEKGLASGWKSSQVAKNVKNWNLGSIKTRRNALVIRAVATLEPECSVQSNGGHNGRDNLQLGVDSGNSSGIQSTSSNKDSEELWEREKLRRVRISVANTGKVPWNKGRKHSAETIQRIKERTWLAMQDPKVKKKLASIAHAQSEETKMKIAVGVRLRWVKRRQKQALQESCHFSWQNLIAEASRRGFVDDQELQWDSYEILNEQLEQEWLESIKQRKNSPRLNTAKRGPKTPEQRRKISEAITAKWTEPDYRDRVYSAILNYHGTRGGVEKKPRKKSSVDRQHRIQSPAKKKATERAIPVGKLTNISPKNSTKPRRSKMPLYKDPEASTKLEMIKNIRAQRAAAETKKTEAIERAKLLIAEAEMAANALEAAARISPVAHASLMETRKLIAEAIKSLQTIEKGQIYSIEDDRQNPPVASAELVNHTEKASIGKINGTQTVKGDIQDFGFGKFNFQGLVNGTDEFLPSRGFDVPNGKEEFYHPGSSDYGWSPSELNNVLKQSGITDILSQLEPNGRNSLQNESPPGGDELKLEKEVKPKPKPKPPGSITVTKKWVRGKLVEVAEVD